MVESLKQLFTHLFDYAGLFPPAKLDMGRACTEYARHLGSPEAFGLAHFVVPASQLGVFSEQAAAMMPGTYATSGYLEQLNTGEPWRVSTLIDPAAIESGLEAVERFNQRHSTESQGLARCDTLEIRVPKESEAGDAGWGGEFVDTVQEDLPDDLFAFFEIDHVSDPRGSIAALSGTGTAAKIRTGGVVPEAYPTSQEIARFMQACLAGDVAFKCTAGLHHPLRGERALTYEQDSVRGLQHGFLNVFVAACMVFDRSLDEDQTVRLLEETDASRFEFAAEGVRWHGPDGAVTVGVNEIIKARQRFCLSIGSCSFAEPVEDLRALGLM